MAKLTLATCQAANTVPLSRALAGYLSQRLARPVRYLEGADWRASYAAIAAGHIDIGWICGRPYSKSQISCRSVLTPNL